MFNVNKDKVKSANLFMSGLALGTLGLKVLTSKDARKVYANVVAAGLRAKDSLMQTAEKVQASGGDILAEAKEIAKKYKGHIVIKKGLRPFFTFLYYVNF